MLTPVENISPRQMAQTCCMDTCACASQANPCEELSQHDYPWAFLADQMSPPHALLHEFFLEQQNIFTLYFNSLTSKTELYQKNTCTVVLIGIKNLPSQQQINVEELVGEPTTADHDTISSNKESARATPQNVGPK